MTLYKQLNADILLIDDNRAKKYANLNDIKTIGSLGILMRAKDEGYIQKIKPFLEKLQKSEIFISEKLIIKILDICEE